jgi:hypothetical protein
MIRHARFLFLVGLFALSGFTASTVHASEVDTLSGETSTNGRETTLYMGVGAGFEAGNGLRFGFSYGPFGAETGGGITYIAETGRLNYSVGGRYIHKLYETAYVWAGTGMLGHRVRDRRARMVSTGAGLGISWHLGPMFRLMLDSGWRVYSDSKIDDGANQINPTFNGALVYAW